LRARFFIGVTVLNEPCIALGIEYDGRPYFGWQRQASGPTVQAALEAALSVVADGPIGVIAAGRTDTGVHAALQVAHFAPQVHRPLTAWVRGVNAHVPETIAVRWAHVVAPSFHARFSAVSRRYTYWLIDRPTRPGLHTGRVGWSHRPLDVSLMHRAAQALCGTHDFSSFRAAECQAKTPVKTVYRANVQRVGEYIRFDIHANAFLHHMVRNIVGALVYVGDGRLPAAQLAALLAARNRATAPPTFAADGLYLCGIEYPPEYDLPESTVETYP
jgi:tRNA pseudouridine38-40 synthase